MSTILGVDPGYAACGLALVRRDGQRWIALRVETVRTPADMPLGDRLCRVYAAMHALLLREPDGVVVEGQARAHAGHRERGTISAEAFSVREVTGGLRALTWLAGRPLIELEPQAWRKAVGLPGNARKGQVKRLVQARVQGLPALLSEHAAEALGIAMAWRVAPADLLRRTPLRG